MDARAVERRLSKIKIIDTRIRRKMLMKAELESCLRPGSLRYDRSKVQTSPQDKLQRVATDLVTLEREIEKLKGKKAQAIREATQLIELLEDETDKLVLTGYFIAGMSPDEIATEAHYSRSSVYYHRRKALREIAEKLCDNCTEDYSKMLS